MGMKSESNCRKTNMRGERFRVLVGELGEAGEGISFMAARDLYLPDVPMERTVRVHMAYGVLPEVLKNKLGSWVWGQLVGSSPLLAKKPDHRANSPPPSRGKK